MTTTQPDRRAELPVQKWTAADKGLYYGEAVEEIAAERLIISAFCDCCSREDSGTKEQLEADGWGLYKTAQFCPAHEI